MLFLLDIIDKNPHRFLEPYLNMVRKYLTRHNVKLEDQIRYRFAVWLLNTEDYLNIKYRYNKEAEETIPLIKHVTDRQGNISTYIRWVKRKTWFPQEHNNRIETLENWKNNLIAEYNEFSCFPFRKEVLSYHKQYDYEEVMIKSTITSKRKETNFERREGS